MLEKATDVEAIAGGVEDVARIGAETVFGVATVVVVQADTEDPAEEDDIGEEDIEWSSDGEGKGDDDLQGCFLWQVLCKYLLHLIQKSGLDWVLN